MAVGQEISSDQILDKKGSEKFSNFIKWSLYVVIFIAFIVFFVVPKLAIMLNPTISPEMDISGFEAMLDSNNLVLVIASIFLAIYSVWQANQSSKQTEIVLNKLEDIKRNQEIQKDLIYDFKSADTKKWGSSDPSKE